MNRVTNNARRRRSSGGRLRAGLLARLLRYAEPLSVRPESPRSRGWGVPVAGLASVRWDWHTARSAFLVFGFVCGTGSWAAGQTCRDWLAGRTPSYQPQLTRALGQNNPTPRYPAAPWERVGVIGYAQPPAAIPPALPATTSPPVITFPAPPTGPSVVPAPVGTPQPLLRGATSSLQPTATVPLQTTATTVPATATYCGLPGSTCSQPMRTNPTAVTTTAYPPTTSSLQPVSTPYGYAPTVPVQPAAATMAAPAYGQPAVSTPAPTQPNYGPVGTNPAVAGQATTPSTASVSPGYGQQAVFHPSTAQSYSAQPYSGQPYSAQPYSAQPSVVQSAVAQPTAAQPVYAAATYSPPAGAQVGMTAMPATITAGYPGSTVAMPTPAAAAPVTGSYPVYANGAVQPSTVQVFAPVVPVTTAMPVTGSATSCMTGGCQQLTNSTSLSLFRPMIRGFRSTLAQVPVTRWRPVLPTVSGVAVGRPTLQPCNTYEWQVRRVPTWGSGSPAGLIPVVVGQEPAVSLNGQRAPAALGAIPLYPPPATTVQPVFVQPAAGASAGTAVGVPVSPGGVSGVPAAGITANPLYGAAPAATIPNSALPFNSPTGVYPSGAVPSAAQPPAAVAPRLSPTEVPAFRPVLGAATNGPYSTAYPPVVPGVTTAGSVWPQTSAATAPAVPSATGISSPQNQPITAASAGAQVGSAQFGANPQAYGQPAYGQPAYGQPADGKPAPVQPTDAKPAYNQPAYNQPGYNQPAYNQPAYNQPAQNQAATTQANYGQSAVSQPAYATPASAQPAYTQPAYSQPAAGQPVYPQTGQPASPQAASAPSTYPVPSYSPAASSQSHSQPQVQSSYMQPGSSVAPGVPSAAPSTPTSGAAGGAPTGSSVPYSAYSPPAVSAGAVQAPAGTAAFAAPSAAGLGTVTGGGRAGTESASSPAAASRNYHNVNPVPDPEASQRTTPSVTGAAAPSSASTASPVGPFAFRPGMVVPISWPVRPDLSDTSSPTTASPVIRAADGSSGLGVSASPSVPTPPAVPLSPAAPSPAPVWDDANWNATW